MNIKKLILLQCLYKLAKGTAIIAGAVILVIATDGAELAGGALAGGITLA